MSTNLLASKTADVCEVSVKKSSSMSSSRIPGRVRARELARLSEDKVSRLPLSSRTSAADESAPRRTSGQVQSEQKCRMQRQKRTLRR